jgi:hypothetical protein
MKLKTERVLRKPRAYHRHEHSRLLRSNAVLLSKRGTDISSDLGAFEMLVTTYPTTQRPIVAETNLQKHRCDNLKSRIHYDVCKTLP